MKKRKRDDVKIDLVVTKNPSFFTYLVREGIVPIEIRVIEHATTADVIGKHVLGDMLPYSLASTTMSYTEIPLHLPSELVGKKLIMEDYEKYADAPVTYSIRSLPEWEIA